jgi:Lipase (class 3)
MAITDKAKAIQLFSQLSNINFGISASIKDLEANSDRIKEIISTDNVASQKIKALWDCDWKVVWGPALNYSLNIPLDSKYHANNSMFVAKGMDKATHKYVYVVAVAGTNGLSQFEKLEEDINVGIMVLWHAKNPKQGHISKGSMIGLDKVLGEFNYGASKTLMEFFAAEIQQIGADNLEIITCGHSLGGALSPLVALKIKETYPAIPVSTYPTAGPTSGDAVFAKYLEDTLGEGNYISVINTNDIVPMAWEHETLTKMPDIYKSIDITMDEKIEKALIAIDKITKLYKYTRIAKVQEYCFTGSLTPPECPEGKKDCDLFMVEALYQHLDMYMNKFFKNEEDTFIKPFHNLVHPNNPNV